MLPYGSRGPHNSRRGQWATGAAKIKEQWGGTGSARSRGLGWSPELKRGFRCDRFPFLQRMTNYGSGVSEPRSVVTLKAWAPLLLPFPVCSGKSLHPSELIIIPNSQGAKMKRHGLCKEIMFLGPGPIGSALERLPAILIVIVSV